jgi:hypothetical protein
MHQHLFPSRKINQKPKNKLSILGMSPVKLERTEMLSPSVCSSLYLKEYGYLKLQWLLINTNTGIDYAKLVEQFGTKLIDDALLERLERITGQKPHRYLRRQIAFSHRDLEAILDKAAERAVFHLHRPGT